MTRRGRSGEGARARGKGRGERGGRKTPEFIIKLLGAFILSFGMSRNSMGGEAFAFERSDPAKHAPLNLSPSPT